MSLHPTPVSGYRFHKSDLALERRQPGIAGFMRIRNGADFLEATIRSHIDALDEIVAVDNCSTDATPRILAALARDYPGKLRLYTYLDAVHPPGSAGHAALAPDAPESFVNMSNFALSRTGFTVAVKLDDDHLAIGDRFARLARKIRDRGCRLDTALCFSGINLARNPQGAAAIPASEPLVGTGDHFFFEVGERTVFTHDPRFESFRHDKPRTFGDVTYWHLKYLKTGLGFANYRLDENTNARFQRKQERFMRNRQFLDMEGLRRLAPPGAALAARLPLPEKWRLRAMRWKALSDNPPQWPPQWPQALPPAFTQT